MEQSSAAVVGSGDADVSHTGMVIWTSVLDDENAMPPCLASFVLLQRIVRIYLHTLQ